MTTLPANKPRTYEGAPERIENDAHPVAASIIIYEGAAVGLTVAAGVARPLNGGAVDVFAGFAQKKADNTGGAAGAQRVSVCSLGYVELLVAAVAQTDMGKQVYATDDDTFNLVATGAVYIGRVHRFVSSGKCVVAFNAMAGASSA